MADTALASKLASEKARAVLDQLEKSGYAAWLYDSYTVGDHFLRGRFPLSVIPFLEKDPRFQSGPFWWMHRDVGEDPCEFRSYKGQFGKGSMQVVISRKTGACFIDVDRFSPYQDLVGTFGHFFGEVLPGWWRKCFG